ncbi:M50 family metallopeptidase [Stackebrandtia soli]|uniref:M50 family metallopeptidase n=1 Tax=Stackebrandtia soli TaxID=1892856 RepID=UPI0039ED9620
MAYVIGVILFALAILISVSLHEAGHMGTAKLFGMRVTRYFIGFGPTLWSFRKGETEYGLKAIPLGGFVKITGMTPLEEEEERVPESDQHRVFWRKPLWQRTVVLVAGSVTHFVLGFLILWILVSWVWAPNPAYAEEQDRARDSTTIAVSECLAADGVCDADSEPSPAVDAGLTTGDSVLAVNGTTVDDWDALVKAIRPLPAEEEATLTVLGADGEKRDVAVTPAAVEIEDEDGRTRTVSQVGITLYVDPSIPVSMTYGPVAGIGAAADFTGDMAKLMGEAIVRLPEKVPALWNAIVGEERDPETPVSVVGASRLGGEMVENDAWVSFFLLLASLNYFVGVFNLLPLLPMDGGHIAIAWYERLRSWWAARRNKPDPGRVDYLKLAPLTYMVLVVMVGFTLLAVTADIVNPITIFD